MWRRLVFTFVVLLIPSVCSAQSAEDLLPAGSQVYFRWDGFKEHQEAANKLAAMKMWNGETGKFLKYTWNYLTDFGETALSAELNPQLASDLFTEFEGLMDTMTTDGVVMGAELSGVAPFEMQITVVFPNAAGRNRTPATFVKTMAKLNPNVAVRVNQLGNRTIESIRVDPLSMAWWTEGKHVVLSVSTRDRARVVMAIDQNKGKLAKKALFKEVQGFKEFPVWFRGYVDLEDLMGVAANASPQAGPIMDKLGLTALKSATTYSGFDGPAERAVVFLNLHKNKRKGLFNKFGTRTITIKELPPMPADIRNFSAGTMEPEATYELVLTSAGIVIDLFAPGAGANIKQQVKQIEQLNNVSFDDVFKSMGNVYATYAAPAEGPLGFGQIQLMKVKDEKKLKKALGDIITAAENQLFGALKVKKINYHGAEMVILTVGDPFGQSSTMFSYTIHKGWMGLTTYPQPLKGYVLRANGTLPTWTASEELKERLAPFPKQFTGIKVSDPRPGIQLILGFLPAGINLAQTIANQQAPGALPLRPFDVTVIPNAYEATRHLFPNVTVTTDEGDRIRYETRASLMFPF